MKKTLFFALASLTLALLALSVRAQSQVAPEEKEALNAIQIIRVVLDDIDNKEGRASWEFFYRVNGVLAIAGFTVVKAEAEEYDATLSISSEISENIMLRAEVNQSVLSPKATHLLSLSLEGSFSLRDKRSHLYSDTFKGSASEYVNLTSPEQIVPLTENAFSTAIVNSGLQSGLRTMVSKLWPERYAMMAILRPEGTDERNRAVQELLKKDKDSGEVRLIITKLADSLQNPMPWTRENAIEVLFELNEVKPLMDLLQQGSVMSQVVVKDLRSIFEDDHNPVFRAFAAAMLGAIKDIEATGPLCAALRSDKESIVRVAAASALGQIGNSGDVRAIGALVNALKKDNEPTVRAAAASALGQFDSSSVIEPLRKSLKDKSAEVREAAAGALEKLQKAGPKVDKTLSN